MKTFNDLRKHAMEMYANMATAQEKYNMALAEAKESGKYNSEYLLKIQTEFNSKFNADLKAATDELREMVKATCAAKRVKLDQMLTTPPTDAQMNLLNALKLQGRNIDPDEVRSIAVQLTGNYRALHALRVLAGEAGINLHIPESCDYIALRDTLDRAEQYLNDRVVHIGNYTHRQACDLFDKMFFGMFDGGLLMDDNAYSPMAALLDSNEQTTDVPTAERTEQN